MASDEDRCATDAGAGLALRCRVVWRPEQRPKVLAPPVGQRPREPLRRVVAEPQVPVHAMGVMPDDPHRYVESDPRRSVAAIVDRLEGATGRIPREESPNPRTRRPSLRSRGNIAAATGAVSEETIRGHEGRRGRQVLLSYKYRLYPNRAQAAALDGMLHAFRDLYNAALQQRIEAYRRRGVSLGYADQASESRAVREADGRLAGFSYSVEQQVLRRLDNV